MRILLISLIIIIDLFGTVIFQENFEEKFLKYDTYETKSAKIVQKSNNKSLCFKDSLSGYIRYKTKLNKGNYLAFHFTINDSSINKNHSYTLSKLNAYSIQKVNNIAQFKEIFKIVISKDSCNKKIVASIKSSLDANTKNITIKNYNKNLIELFIKKPSYHSINHIDIKINNKKAAHINVNKDSLSFFSLLFLNPQSNNNVSYLIDNIIFADKKTSMHIQSPSLKISKIETKINCSIERTNSDSLARFIISDNEFFDFPIIDHTIKLKNHNSFTSYYPLKPDTYYVKACTYSNDYLQTNYTKIKKVIINKEYNNKNLEIFDASIIEMNTKKKVRFLKKNKPYILSMKLSKSINCFTVLWLHHESYRDGNPVNRGGYFDESKNYIFNLSLTKNPWLFASRHDIKGHSIRVDGKNYKYILDKDNFFSVDTNKNTAKIRFKLLNNALPGKWALSAYLEDANEDRSSLFRKYYKLIENWEQINKIKQKSSINIINTVIIIILLIIFSFLFYQRIAKKRFITKNNISQSFYERLKNGQYIIKQKDFSHKHIIIRIQKYIFENFAKDISQIDTAKYVNMSQAWIGRIFKQATGITIVKFINTIRIDKAKDLLQNTNLKITDIAMSTGFNSLDHFRHIFKNFTGNTPIDYRKNKK